MRENDVMDQSYEKGKPRNHVQQKGRIMWRQQLRRCAMCSKCKCLNSLWWGRTAWRISSMNDRRDEGCGGNEKEGGLQREVDFTGWQKQSGLRIKNNKKLWTNQNDESGVRQRQWRIWGESECRHLSQLWEEKHEGSVKVPARVGNHKWQEGLGRRGKTQEGH